jgi:predicted DNA-binding transcriptional regulator AlpA
MLPPQCGERTTMKKSQFKSFDELPLMLTVPDVSNVLGIGLANAYSIVRRPDFPSITLGSRIIIPRDQFTEWIAKLAEEKGEIH